MKDDKKTRKELVDELTILRSRIAELEEKEKSPKKPEDSLGDSREIDLEKLTGIKQVLKQQALEERYRALFENNPIETIIVDIEANVTATNLSKKSSGDQGPQIGDVMYKNGSGKHEIDMHRELMTCIRSGIPKEFPKQKYDCFVTKVINENTFECDLEIDDFFKLYSKETIRIAHIERIRSKKIETITIQSIIEDILLGQMVTLVNLEQSKYGLIISDVYLDDILISQLFVNNDFVKVRKKDKSEIANKLRGKELK